MSGFFSKLYRVKWRYIKDLWKLPVSMAIAPFYKLKHKDLWIVCEDENEARDNGYWFFKFVRENHPAQECVYAIHRSSFDYDKVRRLGRTVEFGSLKHWIMYLASTKKISSQKAGNPNAAIFYFLEVYGFLRDNRVFLQHGITINDAKWLYYNVTKMNIFICGAYPECKFIKSKFGYPKQNVIYTGFPRFDNLHNNNVKREILIMPTWREWIADEDYRLKQIEGTDVIPKTNYFIKWNEFLNSSRLRSIAKKYNIKFVFFPHRNMQKYMSYFPENSDYLTVLSGKDIDIQNLLKEASLMVTDYSSVFFDMIYMKKPVIFYQFDYNAFRKNQYGEGYYNYRNNSFAKSFENMESVFDEIEKNIRNNFEVSDLYLKEHKRYFPIYDSENCKRIYDIIKEN